VNRKRPMRAGLFLVLVVLYVTPRSVKALTTNTPTADSHQMQESAIPVVVRGGFLVIVPGQIGAQQYRFILDTGTAPSILNARLAKKMGLELTTGSLVAAGRSVKTGQAVLPELNLGPIRVANLPVNVMDLSSWEDKLGVQIAGLIGMDVLGRSDFRLDYDRKELTFGSIVGEEGITIRCDGPTGLALAEATVQGKHVRLIVDTGSDLVVVYGANWGTRAGPRDFDLLRGEKGMSVAANIGARPVADPEMELGGRQFRGLPAYCVPTAAGNGYDGFFGVRALKLRGISYDHGTQTMVLLN
jgi:predicted aspartyl protease